jgi:hypothetical protein
MRRFLLAAAAALLLAAGLALGASHVQAEDAALFPSVTGRDLNGRTLQLPRDFAGELNLALVAFQRRQQGDVDSWRSFADALRSAHPAVRAYELPTLSRSYSWLRGFIDGGMRSAIKDEDARAGTVTLYIDKRSFERRLGIASESAIVVLLVRRDGTILWRTTGRFDPAHPPQIDALLSASPHS